jgi:hypothetical protein
MLLKAFVLRELAVDNYRQSYGYLIRQSTIDDGLVLSGVGLILVANLTEIQGILEQFIEGTSGEDGIASRIACLADTFLATDAVGFEMRKNHHWLRKRRSVR